MDGTRKRRVLVGSVLLVGGLVAAPCLAFALVLVWPGMGNAKFVSEADGSTGPAFTFCLTAWAVLSGLAVVAGLVPIALGAMGKDRAGG